MKETDTHKALLQNLVDLLDLNSKTTEELQLEYYVQIADTIVSLEPFQANALPLSNSFIIKTSSFDTMNLMNFQRFLTM